MTRVMTGGLGLCLATLPAVVFAVEPENQSDGARYEAALRSTRCAQLSARSAPDWFKRGFVYQIQPRAFTSEGTLKAATAKLPLVRESGAGIVYLMPVNVLDDETNQLSRICRELGQPKGFYRTKDYFNTDPEFGTNADRKDFVDECHRLGMKVIFDIVLYHCGPSAVLIGKNPNWVERNPDGSIRMGKWGRPVLNFRDSGLREYLYALLGYLVADVGVDGIRCDVAETQPLDFWEEVHRRFSAVKSDVVLICEGYGCPVRMSETGPDVTSDVCRTDELWLRQLPEDKDRYVAVFEMAQRVGQDWCSSAGDADSALNVSRFR